MKTAWKWFGVMGLTLVLIGCAKKKLDPSNDGAPVVAEQSGKAGNAPVRPEFEIWLSVAQKDDPSVPSPLGSSEARKLKVARGADRNLLYIPEVIRLDEGRPNSNGRPDSLFFVLPGTLFGGEIADVTGELRELVPGIPPGARSGRFPLEKDPANQNWYLSINRLLGEKRAEIGPETTHELSFEIQLEDGKRERVILEFRTESPFPQGIGAVTTAATLPTNAEALAMITSTGGRVVATSELSNPLRRPIRAYLRVAPESTFTLDTQIVFSVRPENMRSVGDLSQFDMMPFTSSGALRVSRARLSRAEKKDEMDLDPGHWIEVDLGVGEKAQIEWISEPSPGVPICPRTLSQEAILELRGIPCANSSAPECHFDQASHFRASHFYGHLSVESRMADLEIPLARVLVPELSKADLAHASVTHSGEVTLDTQSKVEGRPGLEVMRSPCQGVF